MASFYTSYCPVLWTFLFCFKLIALKNFSKTTKLITQYYNNEEHEEISKAIFRYAEEHQCDKNNVKLMGVEYPEDIDW